MSRNQWLILFCVLALAFVVALALTDPWVWGGL